jgi:AraC-like DNA-binding protein
MTPIQFQKQTRLHEARARLLADPSDIAGIDFTVGYDSASQFSREYRRAFGVPPSRHVPLLRVQTTAHLKSRISHQHQPSEAGCIRDRAAPASGLLTEIEAHRSRVSVRQGHLVHGEVDRPVFGHAHMRTC